MKVSFVFGRKHYRCFSRSYGGGGIPGYSAPSTQQKKDPQAIIEARLKANKDKPYNPLVLCGPTCGGKTLLIEHFIFSQPELFVFARPYSSSYGNAGLGLSDREIIEGIHYNKVTT